MRLKRNRRGDTPARRALERPSCSLSVVELTFGEGRANRTSLGTRQRAEDVSERPEIGLFATSPVQHSGRRDDDDVAVVQDPDCVRVERAVDDAGAVECRDGFKGRRHRIDNHSGLERPQVRQLTEPQPARVLPPEPHRAGILTSSRQDRRKGRMTDVAHARHPRRDAQCCARIWRHEALGYCGTCEHLLGQGDTRYADVPEKCFGAESRLGRVSWAR
jgi:hypothetical protein